MKTIKARAAELGKKIKKVFEERKQQIKGFASAIGTIFLVSIVTFVILFATGVFVQGPDGFMFNEELFHAYQGTLLGTVAITFILSVLTILL